jgi:hypothetical protein
MKRPGLVPEPGSERTTRTIESTDMRSTTGGLPAAAAASFWARRSAMAARAKPSQPSVFPLIVLMVVPYDAQLFASRIGPTMPAFDRSSRPSETSRQ